MGEWESYNLRLEVLYPCLGQVPIERIQEALDIIAHLHNEAYLGSLAYNRLDTTRPPVTRGRRKQPRTHTRLRPREEWIRLSVPPLIDPALFARSQDVQIENSRSRAKSQGINPSGFKVRTREIQHHLASGRRFLRFHGMRIRVDTDAGPE